MSYGVSWERDLFMPLITVVLIVLLNHSVGVMYDGRKGTTRK